MGIGVLLPGVKRPESEFHHSPLSSGEVKNEWLCASTIPICLHVVSSDNILTFCAPLEGIRANFHTIIVLM